MLADLDETELGARVRRLLDEVDPSDRVAFRGAQFDQGLAWVQPPRRGRNAVRVGLPNGAGRLGRSAGLDPSKLFLHMRAQSIEGGTSEIMRNILGERVLGLPKEPAVDRDRPWRELARSPLPVGPERV